MKLFAYILLGVLLFQPMTADPAWAIRKIEVISVDLASFSDRSLTSQDVEAALLKCSGTRGWKVQPVSAGAMIGRLIVRGKHYVEVDIAYNSKAISVTYRTSRNMRYNAERQTIHNRYSSWVQNLTTDVAACLI